MRKFFAPILLIILSITGCKTIHTTKNKAFADIEIDTTHVKSVLREVVVDSLAAYGGVVTNDRTNLVHLDSATIAIETKKIAKDTLSRYWHKLDNFVDHEIDSASLVKDLRSYSSHIEKIQLSDTMLVSDAIEQGKREAEIYLEQKYGYFLPFDQLDSASLDSATVADVRKTAVNRANSYLANELGSEYQIPTDSASRAQLLDKSQKLIQQEILKKEEFKKLQGSLKNQRKLIDEQEGQLLAARTKLEQFQKEKDLKKKLTSAAKEFIRGHAEELQSVQKEMNELKEVYSKVENSQDLTTAVKQKSLEEDSFGDRLVFGGNVNIGKAEPFSVDLAPLIGYRFNKLFTVGISGIYRSQFERDKTTIRNQGDKVYGYSIFASHLVFRNYFGYLEGENLATMRFTETGRIINWDQALLLGVGRQIRIGGKWKLQVMALYNFLHENDGLFGSPVVVKTGFQFQ